VIIAAPGVVNVSANALEVRRLSDSYPKPIDPPSLCPPLLAQIFVDLQIAKDVVILAVPFAAMSYEKEYW
jgi:hypothetical protein